MKATEKATEAALYKYYQHRVSVLTQTLYDAKQVKIAAQFSTEDLEKEAKRMVRDGVYSESEIVEWILAQI